MPLRCRQDDSCLFSTPTHSKFTRKKWLGHEKMTFYLMVLIFAAKAWNASGRSSSKSLLLMVMYYFNIQGYPSPAETEKKKKNQMFEV